MKTIPEPPPNAKYHPGSAWPASMALVASSGFDIRSIGNAVILRGRLPDFHEHDTPASSISFTLGGTSTVECKMGGRLSRFVASPGGFSIAPLGMGLAYYMDRPLEALNLGLSAASVLAIARREFDVTGTIDLLQVHQKTTPEVIALGQAFADLLRRPRPGSRLYAETLWTQITMQLLWNFSSLPRAGETEYDRLSDARVRRVVDYLRASLAEEISLGDLAEVAGLSPNYFLNAFKKATGKTPHRYLTELRVDRACELLRNPRLSLVQVGLAVGFSSQSHFPTVFGRFMKITPAAYRAQLLGLK